MSASEVWNIKSAASHYRLPYWANGFFGINALGHVTARVNASQLDLYTLSEHLRRQGISLPVLVRFPQILQQTLNNLYAAFERARCCCEYAGDYVAAYPVKVNQQASVMRQFYYQTRWPVAFEVGSKAELMACLGVLQQRDRVIICHGYKDQAYIRLAFTGILLGHAVVIVLESPAELRCVLECHARFGVRPALGMRVRLSSVAKGNWQNTGGEHSKFGLTANQALQLVTDLQDNGVTAWMDMLHFHMGSQIPSLQQLRAGFREGARTFAELHALGLELTKLNVGGGLAIDYQGSRSNSYFSMNYSIDDYAQAIVSSINSVCREQGISAPTIFTESGRAMTAHHAVLITNVVNAQTQPEYTPEYAPGNTVPRSNKRQVAKQRLKTLADLARRIESHTQAARQSIELKQLVREINDGFADGEISLADKARAEATLRTLHTQLLKFKGHHQYRNEPEAKFVAKYICNFSLFQSTPDVWGLRQIFPVLPLHRLDEFPCRKARLHDLTCDSDGRIDSYIEAGCVKPYLSLHELRRGQDYLLGFFLVGAYQEILGDLHNLFGQPYAVNVELQTDGNYRLSEVQPGDTIEAILSYLHLDTAEMRQTWSRRLARVSAPTNIKQFALQQLEASLRANSYLT